MMRYYLYLLVVAICEAGRIARDVDHWHFPNFRAVYHGHGATSYQNVQVDNHDSIPVPANYGNYHVEIPKLEYHTYYEPEIVPIVESHNHIDPIEISDSAPYEEFTVADVELNSDILEHYISHYDRKHYDYDLHL